jgi:tetratricopeptide (TPR) repeat protein
LIEAVKNNGRIAFARHYLFEDDSDTFSRIARRAMPDSQAAVLLELMLPYVQKDSEAVKLKKRNDCPITKEWGLKYLEEYKRLLPKKSSLIEQAVIVCENSEIEVWKKPYFYKNTPLKTSRDYFDFAKEINDKKTQANFLMMASQRAGDEKNYRLASSILDIIEKDFRQYNWSWMKIGAISKQIEELFKEDDFDEITRTLESAPPEYRPFITIKVLNFMSRLKPNHREFVADLMNQARTDFNKIDKYSVNPGDSAINPTQFGQLTVLYVKFGFYDEAIMTHEESIKSFNRLSGTLPPEYKDKKIILRLSSFSRFTNRFPPDDLEFFSRYFDRIYENIGIIENSRIRMHERLGLLEKNLEKPPNTYLIPGIPRIIE